MAASELILVRHGATAANLLRPFMLQGCKLNQPLSDLGERQAAALGEAFKGFALRAVYTSPLERAQATGRAIAGPHGIAIQVIDELTECDLGQWEGSSWDDIRQRWPHEYQQFVDDSAAFPYLGGENFTQVAERALPVLTRLAAKLAGETWVAVCHNIVNRAVLAHWLEIPLRYARRLPQNNGGYNLIQFSGASANVRTINAVSHLSGLLPPD